jgi:hypothetical protein
MVLCLRFDGDGGRREVEPDVASMCSQQVVLSPAPAGWGVRGRRKRVCRLKMFRVNCERELKEVGLKTLVGLFCSIPHSTPSLWWLAA